MEHHNACLSPRESWLVESLPIESWPIEWVPAPLSTDVDEIASYMRVAHAVGALRDRKRSAMGRGE
jgi:hypothetical protein